MSVAFFIVGKRLLNLEQLADAKWEEDVLFLHFLGGEFVKLFGNEAASVWTIIESLSVNLNIGEVTKAAPSKPSR
ncbi:MAG: hypothetical protein M3O30_18870 [Planctomycetota bacterium]|nr:hypothetical protein [Planctomycetota bacterium]